MLKHQIKSVKKRILFKKYEKNKFILNQLIIFIKFTVKSHLVFKKVNQLYTQVDKQSSVVRFRNICVLTSRSRGVFHKFSLSRHQLKKAGSFGLIPGLSKLSW